MLIVASHIIFGITCSFTIQIFANKDDFKVVDLLRGLSLGYVYLLLFLIIVMILPLAYYDEYRPYLRRKYLRLMAIKLFKVERK